MSQVQVGWLLTREKFLEWCVKVDSGPTLGGSRIDMRCGYNLKYQNIKIKFGVFPVFLVEKIPENHRGNILF